MLLAAFLVLVLAVGGVAVYLSVTVDTEADASLFEASRGSRTTRLFYNADRGGALYVAKEWESERLHGEAHAIWCRYEDMSPMLIGAFLAVEDHRFFSHHGVDILRTAKALLNQILHFDERFGGSGITQQLIKNISGDSEQTAARKLREAWRALSLERRYSKEEILELYLNIVPMGEGCVGVGAGAEYYFGKSPGELSAAECATLAAIINAPARYDPIRHPESNRQRREMILSKMWEYEMLDEGGYQAALDEAVTVKAGKDTKGAKVLSWYTETVIDDVVQDLCDQYGYSRAAAMHLLYHGGLEIYTLADPEVQEMMQEAFLDLFVQSGIQYAAAVIDPASGDILGIMGAAGLKGGNRLMNYATAPTAPGSAIKPLSVYAPALDAGLITSASVFDDVPLSFLGESMRAWPRNSPESYQGLCDLGTAIATSKNTVAVRVLRLLGKERAYATLAHSLGFSHLLRKGVGKDGARLTDLAEAPLALGQLTYGTTVRELTSAYTALAGDGSFKAGRTYLAVYDNRGKLLLQNEREAVRAFSEATASIMTKQLERVVNGGTANGVRLSGGIPLAGKTGTSTGGRDKWFVGYSPYYLCGVWCGSVTEAVSVAGKPQLAVFNSIMGKLHADIAKREDRIREFSLAEGVYEKRFCRDGGGLLTVDCLCDPRGDRSTVGWFTDDTLPKAPCACHIGVLCAEGGGVYSELDGALLSLEVEKPEGLKRVGLLRIEGRSFPVQVQVRDAQYVYRPLQGAKPAEEAGVPYFWHTVPKGNYVGISKTEDGTQFNSAYREQVMEDEMEEDDPFSFYSNYFFEKTMAFPTGVW